MGQLEKLFERFINKPRTFKFNDLRALLKGLGYEETNKGKTSGSRVAFVQSKTGHIIRLHKPHPGNEIKKYMIDQIFNELKNQGYIK